MGTFLGGDGSKNAPSQGKKHIDVPFNKETELLSELGPYLPGHPRVNLQDFKQLNSFLRQEFDLRDLALMASKLWMMSQHTHGKKAGHCRIQLNSTVPNACWRANGKVRKYFGITPPKS